MNRCIIPVVVLSLLLQTSLGFAKDEFEPAPSTTATAAPKWRPNPIAEGYECQFVLIQNDGTVSGGIGFGLTQHDRARWLRDNPGSRIECQADAPCPLDKYHACVEGNFKDEGGINVDYCYCKPT